MLLPFFKGSSFSLSSSFDARHNSYALRLCGLPFQNSLIARHCKNGRLQRNQQHSERHASLALLAQSAKVRLAGHGDVVPAACPALEAVYCRRGIDGIEERHGDERGKEAQGGSSETGDCVGARKCS